MSKQLIVSTPELEVLEPSKAAQIKSTFEPMVEMLQRFEDSYNDLILESKIGITKEVTAKAKRLRLDISRVRIDTGKLKDKQKEYIKLEDRAIMGVHNILVHAVKEKEDTLKEIENFFEIQEQKRLDALQAERVILLSPYVEDADERDLSKFADDEFEALLKMKKQQYEDAIEAERIAQEERIAKEKAEAEERERMRLENERLKKEAEERDRLAKIEADKRDAEEKARLAQERKEREERERIAREEREAQEAKLRAEQEERRRIEQELQQKREAEERARREAEEREQAELSKGDADKVVDLISDLEALKVKYTFKSKKNKAMYESVCTQLSNIIEQLN